MDTSDDHARKDFASGHLALLQEYRATVERLFPTLERRTLDTLSISPADALFVGHFLDDYPRRATVLERGGSLGTSALLLASHPKVARVVATDPNLPIEEDVPGLRGRNGSSAVGTPEHLGTLDVARAVFEEYPVARQRVELYDSVEGSIEETIPYALSGGTDASAGEGLIVLINNPQSREEVASELKVIFERHPRAVTFLGNCRRSRSPFVQAGVANFMEEAKDDYHFQLACDLGIGLASSSLGVVYHDQAAAEVVRVLGEVSRRFSGRLDPLRLLQQEEELVENIDKATQELGQARRRNSVLSKQNSELQKRISALTRRNEHLSNHYSSRRYKLADAIMDKASRIESLKRFTR